MRVLDSAYPQQGRSIGSPRLHPVIEDLKYLIDSDARINMLAHQMFEELPQSAPFAYDPTGNPQVRDVEGMLEFFNSFLTRAPEFLASPMGGLPLNTMMVWPMVRNSAQKALK